VKAPTNLPTRALAPALLSLLLPACGGAVGSGVAVGRIGDELSTHARGAPQGAEVCALQDALAALPGNEKLASDVCGKALKSDLLWRKALAVLAAYGETLESLASGDTASTGPLQAAMTGVRGPDWIDAEGGDQAARDAVAKLVGVMANASKGDLERVVRDAGPHVKAICDGGLAYLEAQGRAIADIQRDADKKRTTRTDRRCAQLDGRSVCVGESVVDRMVYADVFGRVALLESSHGEAHDHLAGFCVAHKKLEDAAANGRLGKDSTLSEIVDAVKAVPRSATAGGAAKAAPAKK
jgi:hypothetical protein